MVKITNEVGNGQTVPCETIKNSVLYMETRDKLLQKNSIENNLLDIPKGVNS